MSSTPTTAQATLSQGSTDFSPFVALGGVEQSWAERVPVNVITMGGTLRKASVKKRILKVTLRDMWHEDLIGLFSGITALASWTYLDAELGSQTKYFYLSGPTVAQKLARGGRTLCGGISFTLEEK